MSSESIDKQNSDKDLRHKVGVYTEAVFMHSIQLGHGMTHEDAADAIMQLISVRDTQRDAAVIGGDREYEKYGECPSGCGMQYGCRCDSAESRVRHEQRQRAKEWNES